MRGDREEKSVIVFLDSLIFSLSALFVFFVSSLIRTQVVISEMVDAAMWIQFFAYSGMMIVAMVVFMFIAYSYKSQQQQNQK